MPFPSDVLRNSRRKPVAVELRSGATYNGVLAASDRWMNLTVVDAIITAPDGARFWKVPSVCIRGSAVRTVRVVTEALKENERPPPTAAAARAKKSHRKEGGPAAK
jgi:U6 snRNA-associated Sm-like protein LSm4